MSRHRNVGSKSHKWKQRPNMTIAVDCHAKPHIEPEDQRSCKRSPEICYINQIFI